MSTDKEKKQEERAAPEGPTTRGERKKAPSWLRLLSVAMGATNAAVTGVAVYATMGRGVSSPVFFAAVGLVAVLTAAPIWQSFNSGYWTAHFVREDEQRLLALQRQEEEGRRRAEEERRRAAKALTANAEQQEMPLPEEKQRLPLKELLSPSNLIARKVDERTRLLAMAGSAVFALVAIMVSTFVYPTYLVRPLYDSSMVLILIIALVPPSVLDLMSRGYSNQIDSRIPDFLRDMAESQRTGVPFAKALVDSARSNYGALTRELNKAMAKMSIGMTYEEALDSFADSADTPLAHRAAVLLKEVGRSGGRMLEVLDSVYEHIREVITLHKERSKQLTPYVIVIYASFGVYLFVVYILFSTFFAQVSKLVASGAPFGTNISPSVYYIWFYHMSVIEAVFGGLVAGKISTGTSAAGLKHVLLLLLISFIAFSLFIQV